MGKLTYSTVVRGYALLTCGGATVAIITSLIGLVMGSFGLGLVGAATLALSSFTGVRWMELAEAERRRALEQSQ